MGRPVVLETTATTSSGSKRYGFRLNQKLVYLSNDSSSLDLLVNFDSTTDEAGSFTVKAGEVISDVPMNCLTISVSGVGGNVPFRAMGV